jgi:outer membrane protein assembly factor BamE (lipoprotein component of BamABCDE complex)
MKTSVMVMALALAACAAVPARKKELLTEQDVARLHPGASRAEVRELLGAPQRVDSLPRLEREVWSYKAINDGAWPKDLFVQFSRDGIVREVLLLDDEQLRGG